MPENDVTKMKVADLKRELKLRGLATTGNKNELQDRLQTALIDGELLEDPDTAISGEEELLTDEEEAKILDTDENELLKSPTPIATELTSLSQIDIAAISAARNDDILDSLNTPSRAAKKIVLKRKNSFSIHGGGIGATASDAIITGSTIAKENTEPPSAKGAKMSERHPIAMTSSAAIDEVSVRKSNDLKVKVSQLSLQERLELRAKKFGINANSTLPASEVSAVEGSVDAVVNDEKQIEMLKKRAERFGCVVSSKMVKLDAQEKLLKRKERFGSSVTSAEAHSTAATSNVWAEKARLRLERFGSTPTVKPVAGGATTAVEASGVKSTI